MSPPGLAVWLPTAAVLGLILLYAGHLTLAIRRRALHRRPVLLTTSLLAALAALYWGLVWMGVADERLLRWERPALVLPCSIAVMAVAHRLLQLSPRQSRWRRTLTELWMCASALTAALAAVGVELGRPLDRLAVIVAIDRSRSIDLVPGAESRLRSELQVAETGMRDDDRIGTVVFAAEAAVEDLLRPRTRLPPPQRVTIGRDGTNIGGAIRRAVAEVPADSAARIVVISDGVNTRGDPEQAAATAVAAGVPIDVVPLDQAKVPDVRVVSVRMPPRASAGEWLEIRIVTASTFDAPVEVRVSLDDEPLRKAAAEVRKGEDVLTLRERAPGPGLHRYDVAVSALQPEHDQAPEDNLGSTFVRVRGEAAALVMESDPALAAALTRALQASAFQVDATGPAGVPADVAGFAAYDLLVLSDIQASDLSPTQLDAMAIYVRDLGGGLLLMGGDRSLGPGGYGKTPIEDISPVSFDLKQERRRASLAEIIAIDYSGSMAMRVGKRTKLELANEASVRSAQLLGAGDRLGVMHVDSAVQWTLPVGPVTDQAQIAKKVRAVTPGGGGIFVDLTLEQAYHALRQESVNLKHLLLFSDGDDAERRDRAPALVADAKHHGITTSVVALGRGSDTAALERLSQLGNGRFYLIEDAARLPAVFAQETILASRSAINEVLFRARAGAPGAPTRGIDFAQAPPLSGYVVTIPKGRAQVLLRGPENDPVLATWSVGIGRAATFTSDYKDRWGVRWTNWGAAGRLFAQLGRDITRRADDPRVRLDADASGGQLHLRATVVDDDGRAETFRRLKARVGGPGGFLRDVPLEAVGAGAYAATVPLSRPGAFIATAIDEARSTPVGTTGAVLTAGEELRPTGSDRALLRRLAALTGGKMRDTLAGVFADRDQLRFAYRSLTPWLVLCAALTLLLGVAARRLVLPTQWATLASRWQAKRAARAAAREAKRPTPGMAQTLLAARQKAKRSGQDAASAEAAPPPSVPRFATSAPTVPETSKPSAASDSAPLPHRRRVVAAPGAVASGQAPPSRGLSTAELLLARRRGRR